VISQQRLVEELKQMKEVTNYYPASANGQLEQGGRPRSERTLTRLSQQQELFRALRLDRYMASQCIQGPSSFPLLEILANRAFQPRATSSTFT